jgi:hypothetical protein
MINRLAAISDKALVFSEFFYRLESNGNYCLKLMLIKQQLLLPFIMVRNS